MWKKIKKLPINKELNKMSFYPEIENCTLEELILWFYKEPIDGKKYADVYYQEVAYNIRLKGTEGVNFLKNFTRKANRSQLRGIIFALTNPKLNDVDLRDLLLKYMRHKSSTIVAQAIDGLAAQEEKDVLEKILPFLTHSSPYVRGSVLRFVRLLYPDRALPILLESLQDKYFIVRENVADELGKLKSLKALPYLYELLKDSHPHVRQAAKSSIETLEKLKNS